MLQVSLFPYLKTVLARGDGVSPNEEEGTTSHVQKAWSPCKSEKNRDGL